MLFRFFFLLSLLLSHFAEARFAIEQETDFSIEKDEDTFNIKKDGSYEVVSETLTLLKTERARDEHSRLVLVYRDKIEKLEVLEAKTLVNGKEYKVKKKHIEDKTLASSSSGFDDKRQVIVAFPKAEVGAKVYAKIKMTSKLVITKNNFYLRLSPVSSSGWSKNHKTVISSKIPLRYKLNDPQHRLSIESNLNEEKGTFTKATIVLNKPGTEYTVNEIPGYVALERLTWVALSSLNLWDEILKDLTPEYDKVLSQDLPNLYKEIVAGAEQKESETDQINFVMSQLNEKVHYLGMWLAFKGKFIPRSFKEVSKTHFGDCKDFSTGTVAMLRKLGFDAEVCFVRRGDGVPDLIQEDIPTWDFNHAIVKAVGKRGKVYWLDPTNFTSSAFIMSDISNRHVVVPLNSDNGRKSALQKIPQVENFKYTRQNILEIQKDGRLQHDIMFDLSETHTMAQYLTGVHLRMPESVVEDQLFNIVAGQAITPKDRLKKDIPVLKDRVVKPIKIGLSFIADDLWRSNEGYAYLLRSNVIDGIDFVKDSDVNDWDIGLPGLYESEYVIQKRRIQNTDKFTLNIETPWFTISRDCFYRDRDTVVKTKIKILKRYIPNDALKENVFKSAQKSIMKNLKNFVINFDED